AGQLVPGPEERSAPREPGIDEARGVSAHHAEPGVAEGGHLQRHRTSRLRNSEGRGAIAGRRYIQHDSRPKCPEDWGASPKNAAAKRSGAARQGASACESGIPARSERPRRAVAQLMTTGVPSGSLASLRITSLFTRTHPWETSWPMVPGSLVPWIAICPSPP